MASNPLIPVGYRLMPQRAVTAAMTAWAVQLLHDAAGFPMFATATRVFNELFVLARVEWHQPDFQNHALHRGVTLYAAVAADSAEGVDVSAYQAVVKWDQVAAAKLGFAFIQATEATAHVDQCWAHWHFWQFANFSSVPGVHGAADRDRFNAGWTLIPAASSS